jgi:hypothetical protein
VSHWHPACLISFTFLFMLFETGWPPTWDPPLSLSWVLACLRFLFLYRFFLKKLGHLSWVPTTSVFLFVSPE